MLYEVRGDQKSISVNSVNLGLQLYRQLRRLVDENTIILEDQEAYID